jgi:hypothetical protein
MTLQEQVAYKAEEYGIVSQTSPGLGQKTGLRKTGEEKQAKDEEKREDQER